MLVQCYRSRMPVLEQDPLAIYVQRKGGWMSIGMDSVDYWIAQEYAYMLYVYDPAIERKSALDYYAAGPLYRAY